MQKTGGFLKIISILLFIALVAYITVYISLTFLNPLKTATAVTATVMDLARSEGVVVREESLILSSLPNVQTLAKEGERIPAGGVVAVSYTSAAALETAAKIVRLETEIAALGQLRAGNTINPGGAGALLPSDGGALNAAVSAVSAAVSRHDAEALTTAATTLKALVIQGSQSAEELQSRLQSLYEDLNRLRLSASSSDAAREITLPGPGMFSSLIDGYEVISPATLADITPAGVTALAAQKSARPDNAIGKLISGVKWRYAARLSVEYADRLSVGDNVSADFGRYLPSSVTLRVDHISEPEGGERAVVFSCNESLADTLGLRLVTAEIKYGEISGIRVPAAAICYDPPKEDGGEPQAYIFVRTALYAEKKKITIILEGDGYCLAAAEFGADSLREGNEIFLKTKGLYDGKVV